MDASNRMIPEVSRTGIRKKVVLISLTVVICFISVSSFGKMIFKTAGNDSIPIHNGLPRFTTTITAQADYGKNYFSTVKAVSALDLETEIHVISKPEWLLFRSKYQGKIYAGGKTIGYSNGKTSEAGFSWPYALTSNSTGAIFVADQVDNRIRKISPDGEVSTVAGNVSAGFKNGLAANARFDAPSGSC